MDIVWPQGLVDFVDQKSVSLTQVLTTDTPVKRKESVTTSESYRIFPRLKGPKPIEEKDKVFHVNYRDEVIAAFFRSKSGELVGISSADFGRVNEILSQLQKRRRSGPRLSRRRTLELILEWLKLVHDEANRESLATYFQRRSSEIAKRRKVQVIVSHLQIQSPFSIGYARFAYFKPTDFENMRNSLLASGNHSAENVSRIIADLTSKYQGRVYCENDIYGDSSGSEEEAHLLTNEALEVLRLFSPTAMFPDFQIATSIEGYDEQTSTSMLWEIDTPVILQTFTAGRNATFQITDATLAMLKSFGLDDFSTFLTQPESDFGDAIRRSVHMYSKAVCEPGYEDKLIYLCAALECLLLSNEEESILLSIGLRLAFLIGHKPERRKGLMELIARMQKMRARYIHHGVVGEISLSELTTFSQVLFEAIVIAVKIRTHYDSKESFVKFLNRRILS